MTPSPTSRYAAIAALFHGLDELMRDYQSLPDDERVERWSDEAERITGEVARHLAIARARLSAVPHQQVGAGGSGDTPRPPDHRAARSRRHNR